MQSIEVAAERRKEGGVGARVQWELGETMAELENQFGADVVLSHTKRSFILSLQSYLRTLIDAGKSPEEIQKLAEDWKPGVKKHQKTALERVREEMARMSPADRQILQKELRAKQAA